VKDNYGATAFYHAKHSGKIESGSIVYRLLRPTK